MSISKPTVRFFFPGDYLDGCFGPSPLRPALSKTSTASSSDLRPLAAEACRSPASAATRRWSRRSPDRDAQQFGDCRVQVTPSIGRCYLRHNGFDWQLSTVLPHFLGQNRSGIAANLGFALQGVTKDMFARSSISADPGTHPVDDARNAEPCCRSRKTWAED